MPINEHSHLACLVSLMSDSTFELKVLSPVDIPSSWELKVFPGTVVDLL